MCDLLCNNWYLIRVGNEHIMTQIRGQLTFNIMI